jgi:hypothetical protein
MPLKPYEARWSGPQACPSHTLGVRWLLALDQRLGDKGLETLRGMESLNVALAGNSLLTRTRTLERQGSF